MTVSSLNSGAGIIRQSVKMANDASMDIADITRQDVARRNSHNHPVSDPAQKKTTDVSLATDPTTALVKLGQASHYTRAGVSVVQKEQEMIGSLLDVRV